MQGAINAELTPMNAKTGTCYITSQLVGDDCDEMSAGSYASMAGFAVGAALDVLGVLVSVVLLAMLLRVKLSVDKLTITIVFCGISLLCLGGFCLSQIATFSHDMSKIVVTASGSKQTTASVAQLVFPPLALSFAAMAILQVSLVWITVAQNVERLRLVSSSQARYQVCLLAVHRPPLLQQAHLPRTRT